jgi:hypothetical protein
MNEGGHRPWGQRKSSDAALGCGLGSTILGSLGPTVLPRLALGAFVAARVVLAIQAGSRPGRFDWIAGACLFATMPAICGVGLGTFLEHAAAARGPGT